MQENNFKVFQINECRRIIVSKEFYEQKNPASKMSLMNTCIRQF